MNNRNTKSTLLLILIFLFFSSLSAEDILSVPQTKETPKIDGKLDEKLWSRALIMDNFKTMQPDYGQIPSQKTIAYMTYDEDNIYFAFQCRDSEPDKIKASVSNRDNMYQDDYIAFTLDTFNTMQEGYVFFLNPLGIQGDGKVGSDGNADASYDMVWYSKGQINEQGYSLECRIPLKSIRFPRGEILNLRLGIFRQMIRNSELLAFPPVYPDKGSLLKQSQVISVRGWKYKRVIELLPALTYNFRREHQNGAWETEEKQTDFSLTGKIGLASDMTLDAAYNPDFSQIEADAGQIDINLRYALYYPEKRPFFLEGNDLYNFAGNVEEGPLAMVVHTRRIVDPIFGFKLTGKLGRRNTLAAIYAQDDLPGDPVDRHPDFTILRYRFAMKEDSYIGGFYTGKEQNGGYNRVVGSDGLYRISPTSTASYHIFGSFSHNKEEEITNSGHAVGLNYAYGNRKFILDLGYQDISTDFRIDTGFLTRTGLRRLSAFTMTRFYPKSNFFLRIEPFYWSFHLYDTTDKMFESFNLFTLRFHLPRRTQVRFDGILANEVFAGESFRTNGFGLQSQSQILKQISFSLFVRHTGRIYYDRDNPSQGYGTRLGGGIEYQPMDKLNFGLSLSYSDFYLDEDRTKLYDYYIVRSRNTFQVNKYLFLRAIFEYNSYQDRLTVDTLVSFTYIPGTVIHLGYGSGLEKIRWDGERYIDSSDFFQTKQGVFFKVSYLWRF